MKVLFLLFFTTSLVTMQYVVAEFHALQTEKAELAFIKKYNGSKKVSIKAYVIAAKMKQAEHTMNPIKKVQIFKRHKKELNQLIASNPTNIHARYMRLVIQEKTPSFIGYNAFIKEDKKILKKYFLQANKKVYLEKFIKKNTSL